MKLVPISAFRILKMGDGPEPLDNSEEVEQLWEPSALRSFGKTSPKGCQAKPKPSGKYLYWFPVTTVMNSTNVMA